MKSGRKSAESGKRSSADPGSDSGDEDDIGLVEVLKEKNQALDLDEMDPESLKEKQEDLNRLLQVEQQEQNASQETSGAAPNNDEPVVVHNTSGNSDATVENDDKETQDTVSDASTKSPEYNIPSDDEDEEEGQI